MNLPKELEDPHLLDLLEKESFLDQLWDGTMSDLDDLLAEDRTKEAIESMSRKVRKALDSAYSQGFRDAVKIGVRLSQSVLDK